MKNLRIQLSNEAYQQLIALQAYHSRHGTRHSMALVVELTIGADWERLRKTGAVPKMAVKT